ncbi:FGGY-family carbohydrate kinase [Paracoccus sp. SSK6]|uniref:FGGY-family carbohydrate kinase n=1 Tax=Paracoccus sp. SSK6 TaxID=3143131 RepID=UPI00321A0FEB
MTHIAVIDIGKINAKLALVDGATLAEIAVVTRPNSPLPGPPFSHVDLDGHWQFFLHHLAAFHAKHGVDAISVTTHGAAAVLLNTKGKVAAPMLDYEHPGPDTIAAEYDALRPQFLRTGSPKLPMGLNLGAQLHWLLASDPGLRDRIAHVVTYPQYWGWLLTGELASDLSSLGCHTDLWDPWQGCFSPLIDRLGLTGRMAPARCSNEVLDGVTAQVAAITRIPAGTPVAVGIHDSNASLYPHILGRKTPFAVVSTGTWVVAMAVGGDEARLDPARDVLVNVDALGRPVPSARFMGGREYETVRAGSTADPTDADREAVRRGRVMILPAVEPGSGPFRGRRMEWTGSPHTDGQRAAALSWYLALMTHTRLGMTGARGPVIVEGPFARNRDYCAMLATLHPDGVEVATSATGTSLGAAMLCRGAAAVAPQTCRVASDPMLAGYAADWMAAVNAWM